MSRIDDFAAAVRSHRLVAILRGVEPERLEELVGVLAGAGVRLMEIALSDPDAVEQIGTLRRSAPDEVMIGAGTVTSAALARAALEQGAEFLVTPHVEPEVTRFAADNDLGLLCGALTPTEVAQARRLGARFIKLFPASAMGPGYLRSLLGPYPDLEVLVVGGVGSHNLEEYLRAGALGAGVGGALASGGSADPEFTNARQEAQRLVAELRRLGSA